MSKFISYIAVSELPRLDVDAAIHELQEISAPAPVKIAIVKKNLDGPKQGFILSINSVEVVVLQMAERLPLEAYETAAASSSVIWRDAKLQLGLNKAHVIVGALRETNSHLEALGTAFAVTVISAAVIRLTKTIGVVFDPASTACAAKEFEASAIALAQKQQIPETIWVGVDFVKGAADALGKTTIGVKTTGLMVFAGREIEFVPVAWQPARIAQVVLSVARYLILNGPVIQDGDSIGADSGSKIKANFVARGHWREGPVIQLNVLTANGTGSADGPGEFVKQAG